VIGIPFLSELLLAVFNRILSVLKLALSKYPKAYQCTVNFRNRFFRRRSIEFSPVQEKILRAMQPKKSIRFIQIGSNDGVQGDPLFRLINADSRWTGVFVEPVDYLFQRLRMNYRNDPRFRFENVAIGAAAARAKFYYVAESAGLALGAALPHWVSQLGSFDRRLLEQNLGPDLLAQVESWIEEREVEVLSLGSLLERNGVNELDLVHIDAEGADFDILSQLDLVRFRPSLIIYEHVHLSEADKLAAAGLLNRANYITERIGRDTLAVPKEHSNSI